MESISKFTDYIKSILNKVRTTISKFQKDIVRYYNYKCTLTLVFHPSNKIFLNFSNIYITYPSIKLLYHHIRLYVVEKQFKPILYHLKLLSTLRRLYPVFSIIKLTTTPTNLISRRYFSSSPNLAIINRKEKWEVEKIPDSC